jgi:NAD(P)-dependent dehydrogenase (short-subunit alcohol dehydrogenase family)
VTDSPKTGRGSWQLEDLPDQSGRTFLVTGVTSGVGLHTATELAKRNARVILAARTPVKLADTARSIAEQAPGATLEQLRVDLADLSSVRQAGAEAARFGPIDVLVNNAGVMATPNHRTVDGLNLQMATNHFGPFLLTGLLLPRLLESGDARVVTVSSLFHNYARSAPLGDPRLNEGRYWRWHVYAQSKLANLMFTYELDRRARAGDLPLKALAAHPGYSATHLLSAGQTGRGQGGLADIFNAATRATAQSAAMGALPSLMAATADLPGSTYVGPGGFQQIRGLPRVVGSTRLSRDEKKQRKLWQLSEETVGLRWP